MYGCLPWAGGLRRGATVCAGLRKRLCNFHATVCVKCMRLSKTPTIIAQKRLDGNINLQKEGLSNDLFGRMIQHHLRIDDVLQQRELGSAGDCGIVDELEKKLCRH
jgi:hypothetical protein